MTRAIVIPAGTSRAVVVPHRAPRSFVTAVAAPVVPGPNFSNFTGQLGVARSLPTYVAPGVP